MTTSLLTHADHLLRDAVLHALGADPAVDASDIAVAARGGVITLTGTVNTCGDQLEAERAARRVPGVRAVAVDLTIRLSAERTDTDIAADAVRALSCGRPNATRIQVLVRHAVVTLVGTVPTLLDRVTAERAVRSVHGVRAFRSHVLVSAPPHPSPGEAGAPSGHVDECC